MKAKELIQLLESCDPNLEIGIWSDGPGGPQELIPISGIELLVIRDIEDHKFVEKARFLQLQYRAKRYPRPSGAFSDVTTA